MGAIREELGVSAGGTTADGLFTWIEVECLGACVNAPMLQINDDYYEDLTPATTRQLLAALRDSARNTAAADAKPPPPPGPQSTRRSCENITGQTNLTSEPWGPEKTRQDL